MILQKNTNKVKVFYTIIIILFFQINLSSCSNNDADSTTPSNLDLTITVSGVDGDNPNGDGSGVINVVASANNAVKYDFKFGNGEKFSNNNGTIEYTYLEVGTKEYTITVDAYSSPNDFISASETITIFTGSNTFDNLVFADEFDKNGAVDSSKWIHETQGPNNGIWWNGEKQHYTARTDNSYVSDGTLKILAKKESYTSNGIRLGYTSARLNSKFSFTYGRIDVRAKLPSGKGTWPAIWTLGSNISTVSWPKCGEIDIMEHYGHNATKVASAIHTEACNGAQSNCSGGGPEIGDTVISDYNTEFHVYSIVWRQNEIQFYIDNAYAYKYKPNSKTTQNWPFTLDQFILLNVAMGANWFDIDPNFTESAMEIDYVRVYQ